MWDFVDVHSQFYSEMVTPSFTVKWSTNSECRLHPDRIF
jgi:hypothetical protein